MENLPAKNINKNKERKNSLREVLLSVYKKQYVFGKFTIKNFLG